MAALARHVIGHRIAERITAKVAAAYWSGYTWGWIHGSCAWLILDSLALLLAILVYLRKRR